LSRIIETLERDPAAVEVLQERCGKAIAYFTEQIAVQLASPLGEHVAALAYRKKVKRYVNHIQRIEQDCWTRIERLYGARFLDERLYAGKTRHRREDAIPIVTSVTAQKSEKGGTYRDTLALFRQGKTAQEIAEIRGLKVGTIKAHFARWIANGEIDVKDVLPMSTIELVRNFLAENAGATVSAIRTATGDKFDYNDIRMVVAESTRAGKRGDSGY
jgi:uncharacterized protein YpbB